MNVFIILSVLIIVIGVLLLVTTPSVLFTLNWKGKIVNDKLKIVITNLNPLKRPISAVADNLEFRNAKSIIVKTNNKIKFNLIYDKNRSLQKKIKIEQIRKETN